MINNLQCMKIILILLNGRINSLSIFNEIIFISLGVNDDKAFIIETNEESIEKCFV